MKNRMSLKEPERNMIQGDSKVNESMSELMSREDRVYEVTE